MSYFKNFPKLGYVFNIDGKDELRVMTDLVLNVRVRSNILENDSLFIDYTIEGRDTPELISEKLYGTPLYHWTIMIVNGKYNHIEDFPIDDEAITAYTFKKYRVNEAGPDELIVVDGLTLYRNEYGEDFYVDLGAGPAPDGTIYHAVTHLEYVISSPKILYGETLYRDEDGINVNHDTPFNHIVTNLEYERTENENKRAIRVIAPSLVESVANELLTSFESFHADN
jgi:hypothetical protein